MIRLNYFFIAALFFVAGTQILIGEINQGISHPAGIACQQCHMSGASITPQNAQLLFSSQEKLCASCHENALKVSHPSGFNPGRAIPEGFPLDWKNEITCSTCHNVHASKHASIRGGISGKELCLSCHEMSFFRAMANNSLTLQTSAIPLNQQHALTALENYSSKCMSCHTSNGGAGGITVDHKGIMKHSGGTVHPLGITYKETYPQDSYRSRLDIARDIKLPDGKLSCISCHRGYSNDHSNKTAIKSDPAPCDSCHIM